MQSRSGAEAPRPAAVQAQLHAERIGQPFLAYRDGSGVHNLLALDTAVGDRLVLGRGITCRLCLSWDSEVSRTHAELVRAGDEWMLTDDGLSKNGTFVNGQRLVGRRRMADGDVVRVGSTNILFRAPLQSGGLGTTRAGGRTPDIRLTVAQRRVLVALCRPVALDSGFAPPATNQQIADELFLGTDVIKSHLRALFERFEVGRLPQNAKRARLVQVALESGLLSERELRATRPHAG